MNMLPLAEFERRHILKVLELCGGQRKRTASAIGISVRSLQMKLASYHVAKPHANEMVEIIGDAATVRRPFGHPMVTNATKCGYAIRTLSGTRIERIA